MAAIDLNTVRGVIEGRLNTELASSPAVPVVFYNQSYTPTPGDSFVQCLFSFGEGEYLSLGGTSDSSNKVVGAVTINIFTGQSIGAGANYVIGKRIRDLYNRQVVSGVVFDPVNGPTPVANPEPGGFFQTQLRMTFEAYEDL